MPEPRLGEFWRRGRSSMADRRGYNRRVEARFAIIIVDAVRPYAYEINNILSLPQGFSYRCRYRQRRVRVDRPAERLQHTDGLVILRCFENARLYPIRKIQVKNARKVGDIVYVEYILRDWIRLSSSVAERQPQIDRFNTLVSASLMEENKPGSELNHLVFFGTDFCYFLDERSPTPDDPTTDDERWGNIVDEVRRIPIYHEYDFLKVVRLTDERQHEATVLDGDGYVLRPHGTYELEMLQRRHALASDDPTTSKNRLIRLLMNERDYRPIDDTFSVSARYDLFSYRFQTTSDRARRHSFFLVRSEPSTRSRDLDAGHAQPPPASSPPAIDWIPDIVIPAVIDPTRSQQAVRAARVSLAVLLLGLYVGSGPLLDGAAGRGIHFPLGQNLVSQISLILFILVVTGSLDAFLRTLTTRLR
jgi:hypothetical protein